VTFAGQLRRDGHGVRGSRCRSEGGRRRDRRHRLGQPDEALLFELGHLQMSGHLWGSRHGPERRCDLVRRQATSPDPV